MLATLNSRILLNRTVDRNKTAAVYNDWHSSDRSGGTRSKNSADVIQIHTKVETAIRMDPYHTVSYFPHHGMTDSLSKELLGGINYLFVQNREYQLDSCSVVNKCKEQISAPP
jgi:hypothetical protein